MEPDVKKELIVFAVFFAFSLPVFCSSADDKLFEKLDKNSDGSVSMEEFMRSDIVVVTREDGKQELQHKDFVKEGKAAALSEMQKRKFWEQADHNRDGRVDRKEWSRASPEGFVLWRF